MRMMYRIDGWLPFNTGRMMMFYPLADAKRYLKDKYPTQNIELWLERGVGPTTTVVEKWERPAGHKNFRRVAL